MRRRLLISNLILVTTVLVALEVPLAVVYARHEHDALNAALQRDAGSLAALSEEIVEHPGEHNVGAVAQQFTTNVGDEVAIVDRRGANLVPLASSHLSPYFGTAIDAGRAGHSAVGETHGLSYAVVPVGATSDSHGAVLVARSDGPVDHRIRLFWLALLGIGAAVLAVAILVSRRLARWTVDPLQRLDQHALELGTGALGARADISSGPPEVIALARTFNNMAARLDELMSSQRRFIADASHQLRTPLTALRLRLENLDTQDSVAVTTARDAALQESARLTRIVDGLLGLARAEGLRPNRQPVDVGSVLEQRQRAWAPLAGERGVELRCKANGHVTAYIVPGHLEQILDNLIDNALDATPPHRAVVLSAGACPEGVEIHVTDEGHGMSDDQRKRAFEPFWRNGDARDEGHTGLGLAIVDQLTRTSSGSIELQAGSAGGTDAVIRFPSTP